MSADAQETARLIEDAVRRFVVPAIAAEVERALDRRNVLTPDDVGAIARAAARDEANAAVRLLVGKEFIITITEAQR